ncbi:MAG: PQQ-like beta-propeller repeat protein [Thermoanaerobaculia bacterium]|nr:PQQ-like beta-propeller repeat protein [Thermoanaerobaculia bacterium]
MTVVTPKSQRVELHRVLSLAVGLLLLTGLGVNGALFAADWPQYRGVSRDGHATGEKLLSSWQESGPKELWRVEAGEDGYSSMAIADGKVFTLIGTSGTEMAVAHDAATGKRLWHYSLGHNRPDGQGGGPRGTPTIDGDTLYALGAKGQLVALEAATGKLRWKVDLVEEYGAKIPQWGVSGSPLVVGDQLLVEVGGRSGHALASFDKKSGKLIWASGNQAPGYSSPLSVEVANVPQILFFTGSGLVSVSPKTGETYFEVPWRTSYDVNAVVPIFVPPNGVFISSAYDVGSAFYRIEKQGDDFTAKEVWKSREMRNHFNSSVLVGQQLYGFDNGTLKCIDVATGEERWAHRGLGKGSLIYADGHLVVLGEQGQLLLVEATPEAFHEVSSARPFKARTWSQPALADGVLFLRSQTELVALRVGAS